MVILCDMILLVLMIIISVMFIITTSIIKERFQQDMLLLSASGQSYMKLCNTKACLKKYDMKTDHKI